MEIIHKIKLDLASTTDIQQIKAMQNDSNTRVVEAMLLCNGQPWAVPAGVKAAVAFRKQDGTSGLYDELPDGRSAISYSVDRTVVKATLVPEVLTFPREVSACLTLMDDALNKLSTFPFKILVEKNPSADGVVSQNYYNYQDLADINDHLQGIIEGTFPIATDPTLTKAQMPANAKATGEAIAALAADLSAVDNSSAIVAETTGSAIALTDASNRPLQGLTIYGKTAQNGTPSSEVPVEPVNAGQSGSVTVNVHGKNLFGGVFGTRYPLFIPAGTAITASTAVGVANSYLYLFREDGSSITYGSVMGDITVYGAARKYRTFTPTEDVYAVLFQTNETGDYQIEFGSAATAYEAYKAAQNLIIPTPNGLPGLPVTGGGNYTDENGHYWSDYRDCGRGVDGKRIAELVLTGDEAWVYSSASYANWAYAVLAKDALAGTPVLCTHYVGVSGGSPAAGQISITSAGSVVIKADNIQSKEDVKAILAAQRAAGTPVKVRYVLAEPVETPMDHATLAAYAALRTYKPNTTILSDAGAGMKVAYVADTKAYIDNKFAAVIAAIMNT